MRTIQIDELLTQSFELAIATCGYETRSSYIFNTVTFQSNQTLVMDYLCTGVINYDINKSFYLGIENCNFIEIDERISIRIQDFLALVRNEFKDDATLRILIDISSCSRSIMAKLLIAISHVFSGRAEITCVYALSAFDSPPDGELPSHISEPVVGDLSGWSDDLSKPPCAVIGMGFEPGRALGCMDYLEIPEVRLFMPNGVDKRFEIAVREANAVLIDEAGNNSVLPYQILDPAATYEKMESLMFGLLARFRPVIIPLGPKVFAALSMILAIRMLPRVCVWRTSSGSIGEAADRTANGEIAAFITLL